MGPWLQDLHHFVVWVSLKRRLREDIAVTAVVVALDAQELVDAAAIAARLGVTKQMIHHWRRRNLGLPDPVRELT